MLLRQLSALQRAESNFAANIFLNTKTWLKWTLHSIELNFLCACVPRDFSSLLLFIEIVIVEKIRVFVIPLSNWFYERFFSLILFGFSSVHRSLYCLLSVNQIFQIFPFYSEIRTAPSMCTEASKFWYKIKRKEWSTCSPYNFIFFGPMDPIIYKKYISKDKQKIYKLKD